MDRTSITILHPLVFSLTITNTINKQAKDQSCIKSLLDNHGKSMTLIHKHGLTQHWDTIMKMTLLTQILKSLIKLQPEYLISLLKTF